MNPLIRYRLWRISGRANPDAAFLARLECAMRGRGALGAARRAIPVRRLATAACAVTLALGVGTSAYAYASDDVLIEHPLYPLREAIEAIEERAAPTAAAKAAVRRKHLERKLEEIRLMQERRSAVEGELLERVETVLEQGLTTSRPHDELREELIREIRSVDEERLPPPARANVRRLQKRFEVMEKLGR